MKKYISLTLIFAMMLSILSLPQLVAAEELSGKVYYENDFYGEASLDGLKELEAGKYEVLNLESGESVLRLTDGGSLSDTSSKVRFPSVRNSGGTDNLPPIAAEYRVRIPSYQSKSLLTYVAEAYDETSAAVIGGYRGEHKVRFGSESVSKAFATLDSQAGWHTFTILYSNTDHTRKVYIDGALAGETESGSGKDNNWYDAGAMGLTFLFDKINTGSYAEFDYVRYFHPEYTPSVEIKNHEKVSVSGIPVTFTNPPVVSSLEAAEFTISGGVEVSKVIPSAEDSKTLIVIPGEGISEFTDYTLNVSGVKDGLGAGYSGEVNFTTTGVRTVTVSYGENGALKLQGSTVENGESKSFDDGASVEIVTVPEEGFRVASFTVNGEKKSEADKNLYRITVTEDSVIEVLFEEIPVVSEYVYYMTDFDSDLNTLSDEGWILTKGEGDISLKAAEGGESVLSMKGVADAYKSMSIQTPVIKNRFEGTGTPRNDLVYEYKLYITSASPYSRLEAGADRDSSSKGISIGGFGHQRAVRWDHNEPTDLMLLDKLADWHTVSIVYSGEKETSSRDLYLDGAYIATSTDKYESGFENNWANKDSFANIIPVYLAKDNEYLFDYVRIYERGSFYEARVQNSESTAIGSVIVEFTAPPVWASVNKDNFAFSDGTKISEVRPVAGNANCIEIIPESYLGFMEDYTLSVSGVNDGTGRTCDAVIPFTTGQRRQTVKSIGIKGADKLTAGENKIEAEFINEYEDSFFPLVFAVQTDASDTVKKVDAFEYEIPGKKTASVSSDINILEDTSLIRIFAVKGKAEPGIISGISSYTLDGSEKTLLAEAEEFSGEASLITPEYNREKDTIKISLPEADGVKTVFVLKDGASLEDDGISGDAFVYADAVKGNEVSFVVDKENELFAVSAYAQNGKLIGSGEIQYIGKKYTDRRFAELNGTEDTSVVISYLDELGAVMGIDITAYSKLDEEEKVTCASSIIEERNTYETKEFKDIASLSKAVVNGVATARMISGSITSEELVAGADMFGAVVSEIITGLLTDASREYFAELIREAECKTPSEVREKALECAVIAGIYKAVSNKQIAPLMKAAGADMSIYNTLRSPSKADAVIMNKEYESISDAVAAFEKAAKTAKAAEGSGAGSGGGGGGGGGSAPKSKDLAFTQPEEKKEEESNENKAHPFKDLSGYEWAEKAISALYAENIVSGKSAAEFAPADKVTRSEFIKLTVSAFGLKGSGKAAGFTDVTENDWFFGFVNTAFENGIVSGTEEGKFSPGSSVTREMAATILFRAAKGKIKGEKSFTDSGRISSWAKDGVSALAGAGIIKGYEDGSFRPLGELTRAEAAQLIYGLLEAGGEF